MSSNPPCSHSRLHLYHPTLDIRTQDHTVEVSGTFKGFHVHARYVLDWHGMCPVEWSVRDKHGRACVEVGTSWRTSRSNWVRFSWRGI